jgi:signal peptidase I
MKELLKKSYKFSNSWTGTIIIVLFVIFFIAQAFRIPSGSMKDSLLIGDHLFAKKICLWYLYATYSIFRNIYYAME